MKQKALCWRKVGAKDNFEALGSELFGPSEYERLTLLNVYYHCSVDDKFDESKVKKVIGAVSAPDVPGSPHSCVPVG